EGTDPKIAPHRVMQGNHPTTTILAQKLTPSVFGQLIALYEHITFTQGTIWEINSFDQWGVELGKVMANNLAPKLTGPTAEADDDSSTNNLIKLYRAGRGR
ncbi:MAG: glucose-6-phosphate isomerase, partial [Actinoplanes sp.]